MLDDPVELAAELDRILGELVERALPAREDFADPRLVLTVPVVLVRVVEELALQVDGGGGAPVLHADGVAARQIARDRAERLHGLVDRQVAVDEIVLDHAEHDGRRAHLQIVAHFAHVGVARNDVQAPVFLRIGVGLVARVDDRTRVHRLQADFRLEEVRALGDLVVARLGIVLGADLTRAREDLSRDEERHHVLHDPRERHLAVHQVVLVRAVRVALVVRVVLQNDDALLGRRDGLRALTGEVQHALACAIPDHAIPGIRRLRARVFGVRVVHVEPRPVREDEVDETRLLFRGNLFLFHVFEPASVSERALRLVVPAHARGPVGLVRVDEEQ